MDVYKDVVKNTAYQKFSYGVDDINNVGIEELIFKTGSSEADYNYYIYTYDESFEDSKNHVVLVGDYTRDDKEIKLVSSSNLSLFD